MPGKIGVHDIPVGDMVGGGGAVIGADMGRCVDQCEGSGFGRTGRWSVIGKLVPQFFGIVCFTAYGHHAGADSVVENFRQALEHDIFVTIPRTVRTDGHPLRVGVLPSRKDNEYFSFARVFVVEFTRYPQHTVPEIGIFSRHGIRIRKFSMIVQCHEIQIGLGRIAGEVESPDRIFGTAGRRICGIARVGMEVPPIDSIQGQTELTEKMIGNVVFRSIEPIFECTQRIDGHKSVQIINTFLIDNQVRNRIGIIAIDHPVFSLHRCRTGRRQVIRKGKLEPAENHIRLLVPPAVRNRPHHHTDHNHKNKTRHLALRFEFSHFYPLFASLAPLRCNNHSRPAGNITENRLPLSGSLATRISPPCSLTMP